MRAGQLHLIQSLFWSGVKSFAASTAGNLEEALALEPNRADCLDQLAEARRRIGRPAADFIDLLRRAVEAAPSWVLPRAHLALALRDVGRGDEAIEHLRLALERDGSVDEPSDPVEFTYEWEVTGRIGSRAFIEAELTALLRETPRG